ncbi:hypothetical protein EU537_11345 [Candidatus Thorarchaeota archaeon]|nr:MAG: hypothetical protein EU537_11345 [Candidatus Thorarchaeota archaeon]
MPRRERGISKKLAAFGEKQFEETGASRVEVLRVKASTIRKHFKKLRGIRFLVSVLYLDRVRVYFFSEDGVMLMGDNIEPEHYEDISNKSRLLRKFEKPTPPTELEVRMELTEEFRELLSKSIKRVARYLNESAPEFPDIYLTSENIESSGQSFGTSIDEDGSYLLDQNISKSALAEGIALRISFLSHLDPQKAKSSFIQTLSNSIAYALLNENAKEQWRQRWLKESKETSEAKFVGHFIRHIPVYKDEGFSRILTILKSSPVDTLHTHWEDILILIHDTLQVSLGTGASHTISMFCDELDNACQILQKKHVSPEIHLAPRAICNPIPLGYEICISWNMKPVSNQAPWFDLLIAEGSEKKRLTATRGGANPIEEYQYYLNLSDAFPKTTGLGPHGRDIISWALEKLGLSSTREETFAASLSFRDITASPTELAVLERLSTGDLEILANSLVGSRSRITSLIHSGGLIMIPDFNHIGLKPNLLIQGKDETVFEAVRKHALEMTVFKTSSDSFSVISAPSEWRSMLLLALSEYDCSIYPILKHSSAKRWLRDENLFPHLGEIDAWNPSN